MHIISMLLGLAISVGAVFAAYRIGRNASEQVWGVHTDLNTGDPNETHLWGGLYYAYEADAEAVAAQGRADYPHGNFHVWPHPVVTR